MIHIRMVDDLAARLIDAQEEERRRIGLELRDQVGQTLSVLTFEIDRLRVDRDTPPRVALALEELHRATSAIANDVRRLSHQLHSSTLDYLGLIPALQKLVADFSQRYGIMVTFAHAALPTPLPSSVALCLFRIVEDSLANIARHSQARTASVQVTGRPDVIHLRVEDAGIGFDMTRPGSTAGLGLIRMQERLRVLHGTVLIESAPSRGTRVNVSIPTSAI